MKKYLVALLLGVTVALGAGTLEPQKEIRIVLAAEYFNPSAFYWEKEVARRYDDAIILFTHGGPGEDGKWYAYTDLEGRVLMTHLVSRVRLQNPGKRIVVVACNKGGLRDLDHIPNVTYALDVVWMFPDRNSATDLDEWAKKRGSDTAVGSIFEFVETDPYGPPSIPVE